MSKSKVKEPDIKQDYWEFERTVAWSFNKLKARSFNLVEASITDEKQSKAIIGLLKGFANDEYVTCIKEMRYVARNMGLIGGNGEPDFPISASPLEKGDGVFG